ncbi:MAG: hypothetical protein LBT56_08905 [Prevotellaceae bacterium]|jgi:cell division protein FtsN|nr:hypothetical protein [Prevotellaceae bacterium]
MKLYLIKLYLGFIFYIVFCFSVSAQDYIPLDSQRSAYLHLLQQAKQLHNQYQFAEAIAVCENIINSGAATSDILDSAKLQIVVCENSRNLVHYLFEPKIVGKLKVENDDFIAYYDKIKNGYFAPHSKSMLMNADKGKEQNLPLVFYPNENNENSNIIYFSSYGKYGESGLDIYKIHRINDTVWSEPELLETTVNTQFDEIYPYITEDGKTLYFASKGHYGMGGFDLFKCAFDEEKGTWKQAENLGFPFSSPYDDFLYIPDNDNDYACFGSTRNCENKDVFVYKTEIIFNPEYKSIDDYELLQKISNLDVFTETENNSENENDITEVNIAGLENNKDYIKMLKTARYYTNKFNEIQKSLDVLRNKLFDTENAEEQKNIEKQILDNENELFDMQSLVSELSIYISKSEYNFITKGIQPSISDDLKTIVNIEFPQKKEEKINIEIFGKKTSDNIQTTPNIEMKTPALTERDMFGFEVNGKIIIAQNYVLPSGLVYRIQVISVPANKKVESDFFKNCSPVTTELYNDLCRYYIGLFRKQSDAENAMAQLKILGFKNIFISAYNNGEIITLRDAKNIESKKIQPTAESSKKTDVHVNKIYRITIGPIDSKEPVVQLINDFSDGKDISKIINSDNKIIYNVGNFTTFEQAVDLRDKLINSGIASVNINEIVLNN